jgi:integrase/recombinase XerD
MNEPAYLLHCQRILTMPGKRYVKRTVTFLDREEIAALLAGPDRSTPDPVPYVRALLQRA